MERIPFTVDFMGYPITGWFKPVQTGDPPRVFHVTVNNSFIGTLENRDGYWRMDGILGNDLAPIIGEFIIAWWQ